MRRIEKGLISWCAEIIEEPEYCKKECEDYNPQDKKCHRYEGIEKNEFDKKYYA